jgi:pilus assembly protein CpaE
MSARVYVTGTCDGLAELVEALGAHQDVELLGSSDEPGDGSGVLRGGHLDVVVHALRARAALADELAALREHTGAPIVVVAAGDCGSLLEEALDAGAVDLLSLPRPPDEVVFAIRKASHGARRVDGEERRRGRVVTVFSPKGGTGKTVTSVNLATSLAHDLDKRTLLVDLDLQFGDAAIMLGVEPSKTIYDLVAAPGELDSDKVAGYATRHASGLDVLPAPLRPEDAELVTEARLTRLLEVARRWYDVVVVDTPPVFYGAVLPTLDRTDDLLLLCAMDVPTIKNVRLSLRTLELLSFPTERIKLVLNRANTEVGLKRSDVERTLETTIRFDLPSDRAVPTSVNRGQPAVLAEPSSRFAAAIGSLARELVDAPQLEPVRRRWRSRQRA